jgi:hypothetical protein
LREIHRSAKIPPGNTPGNESIDPEKDRHETLLTVGKTFNILSDQPAEITYWSKYSGEEWSMSMAFAV